MHNSCHQTELHCPIDNETTNRQKNSLYHTALGFDGIIIPHRVRRAVGIIPPEVIVEANFIGPGQCTFVLEFPRLEYPIVLAADGGRGDGCAAAYEGDDGGGSSHGFGCDRRVLTTRRKSYYCIGRLGKQRKRGSRLDFTLPR